MIKSEKLTYNEFLAEIKHGAHSWKNNRCTNIVSFKNLNFIKQKTRCEQKRSITALSAYIAEIVSPWIYEPFEPSGMKRFVSIHLIHFGFGVGSNTFVCATRAPDQAGFILIVRH